MRALPVGEVVQPAVPLDDRRAGMLHQVKGAHDQPADAAGFEIGAVHRADDAARRVGQKDREIQRAMRKRQRR